MKRVIFWSGFYEFISSNTPQHHMMRPMASYQLSHWLRKHRFECQVIEFIQHFTADEIVELTEPFIDSRTIAIGISTVFWPLVPMQAPNNILEAIKKIKEKYPTIKIVAGGSYTDKYNVNDYFDEIFRGDGEDTFLKWCQEQSYGVSLPNRKFDIKENDHLFQDRDCIMPDEALPIELGRGCIFKCGFCFFPNLGKEKGTYIRNPIHLKESIVRNRDLYGTTNYVFLDDTCNEDQDKIQALVEINKSVDFKLKWSGYCRADLIWSHKNHNVLLDSGLDQVYFGVETFHTKASQSVGKGWNGKYAKDWIPVLHNDLWNKQVGMEGSFIVGLPHEDLSSLQTTVKWLEENSYFRGYFRGLKLLPGSAFTENPEKHGYTKDATLEWTNNTLPNTINGKTAHNIAEALNNQLISSMPLRGFWVSELYGLHYSKKEIESNKFLFFKNLINYRKENFLKEYKKKLRSFI
jgi:radical SAM superfamily enzyme YgiQ (UPF0313 family)